MVNTLVLIATLANPGTAASRPSHLGLDRPRVEVWTNRGDDPYHAGQHARVFVHADRDAFVAIFRVDTDGRVRVLFPRDPWDDPFVRGGRDFEVTGFHRYDAFEIDDYPGVGYVFAVASADPFEFAAITRGDHWDYRVIADGRVRGDPYVALTDLAQRIVPVDYGAWDYDIVPYYVERHYDYPRFLCYDCHSYASYAYWNPYAYSCVRFRIVVFDDPYYYPYRYYAGTRVVFVRPFRPQPRFIFKDRGGVGDDRFVTRQRERPVNDNGRRGVRGVDLGGRGAVPVPRVRRDERERRRDLRVDDAPQRRERPLVPDQDDRERRQVDPDRSWRRPVPQRQDQGPRRPAAEERRRPTEQPERSLQRPDDSRRPTVSQPDQGGRRHGGEAQPRENTRGRSLEGRRDAPSPKGKPELWRRRP